MGTNYYLEQEKPCPCCKRGYEQKHIGKSSGGWAFALHIIPEEGINDLEDWRKAWEGKTIVNEYGAVITEKEMMQTITKRTYMGRQINRSVIDNNHCVGHGDGTWDLILGCFS